jgi:hypothetical protein
MAATAFGVVAPASSQRKCLHVPLVRYAILDTLVTGLREQVLAPNADRAGKVHSLHLRRGAGAP